MKRGFQSLIIPFMMIRIWFPSACSAPSNRTVPVPSSMWPSPCVKSSLLVSECWHSSGNSFILRRRKYGRNRVCQLNNEILPVSCIGDFLFPIIWRSPHLHAIKSCLSVSRSRCPTILFAFHGEYKILTLQVDFELRNLVLLRDEGTRIRAISILHSNQLNVRTICHPTKDRRKSIILVT